MLILAEPLFYLGGSADVSLPRLFGLAAAGLVGCCLTGMGIRCGIRSEEVRNAFNSLRNGLGTWLGLQLPVNCWMHG